MAEEIAALRTKVSMEDAQFTRSAKSMAADLRQLKSEMNMVKASGKEYENSMSGMKQQSDILSRTLTVQQQKLAEIKKRYDESVRVKGADADETKKLAAQYNNVAGQITRTQTKLKALTAEIKEQSNPWNQLSQDISAAGDKIHSAGEKMFSTGRSMTVGVTTPILGFGAASVNAALEFDGAAGKIQAQLGSTSERAEELAGISKGLWKDAVANNVSEASEAIRTADTLLKGLSNEQLENVAIGALDLQRAFEYDVKESIRSAKSLVDNFGVDGAKAFDYITVATQKTGDYSNDLLDTINEYSPQFKAAGIDVNGMFNILVQGAQNGAFNMDKVGDAVKEFNIKAKDGSKTTADGFKAIGLNADEMAQTIAKGGEDGERAFMATITALAAVEDPVKRNTAGVALFGTQFEDLESKVISSLDPTKDMLGDVEGATKKAGDAMRDNFGTEALKVWRDLQEELLPVGEQLLDIAEDVMPRIVDMVGGMTDAFSNLSPEMQTSIITIAGITAAAGPALMGLGGLAQGIGGLVTVSGTLIGAVGGSAGLGATLATLATGPVGITIGALALLAGGVYAVNKSMEAGKEVNLEHAQSLLDQQQSFEGLIVKYDELRTQNQLTNEQLLRFRDIQSELKTASSADEIARLKDEAAKLQENSGLSNDELSEMLTLNDEIIAQSPTTSQAFSDKGEAIIENTDQLHEANEAMREQLLLELETQKAKADAKVDENIRAEISAREDLNAKIIEFNNARVEEAAQQYNLDQLKKQQQDAYNSGHKETGDLMQTQIDNQQALVDNQGKQVAIIGDEIQEKQKSLEQSQQELEKNQQIYDQMINLQLAQAGINQKGAEGITQLDQSIEKTNNKRNELINVRNEQGGLNAKQEEELANLNDSLNKYNQTKSSIQEIQGEQDAVNGKINAGRKEAGQMSDTLSKSEAKDIKFTGDGYDDAKIISDETARETMKKVEVTDYGKAKAITDEAGKSVTKNVSIVQTITQKIKGAAKTVGGWFGFAGGTRFAPGGMAWVGEQGKELMHTASGLNWVGEHGKELMYVPRGAQIIPHGESMRMARATEKDYPGYATGTLAAASNVTNSLDMFARYAVSRVRVPSSEKNTGTVTIDNRNEFDKVVRELRQVKGVLNNILEKDSNTYLDGKLVSNQVDRHGLNKLSSAERGLAT
ncbi:phage tail tape measure protein [Terribacillus saccharophilus]|uniref:phage tail tape measure protein n=1 Tax=Terribacillus saccharophilus TaxID=361277 RepID=UPI002DC756BF|nr:phage tail tape measure protein [Terribacillus saccharophilus]MEC0288805.1 phage tail tape measure protein [Terribacillus saccharophilus]